MKARGKLRSILVFILILTAVLLTAAGGQGPFPDVIPLPNGFFPEGIAVGKGHTFFTGSLVDGAIYRGDLRTGEGDILAPGVPGLLALGMDFDERSGNLFVAGGSGGDARVYDGDTGLQVAAYDLGAGFINDVIVTRDAAYFTNSFAPVFYRIPLGPAAELPDQSAVETITFAGDWIQVPGEFNANGIEASSNGKVLIVVNSVLGALYKVDPNNGTAVTIDLGSGNVASGDGLARRGMSLYVVQNFLNQIAEVSLAGDFESGEVVNVFTNPAFDIPTTGAVFGSDLYVVNARFTTPPGPGTTYDAVKVPLK
ncbi:MAG: hypothetical protein R3335_06575 [Anaerolineales bacterium]|nr:hypothetical protein [Anaerolineales bacterium]